MEDARSHHAQGVKNIAASERQHKTEAIHGREKDTTPEEAKKHNAKMMEHWRGFHHSDAVKAAEELRMEGKGSHDPHYENSKKNK